MSILPGLQFGSGIVLAAPQTTSGNPATNPTPLTVGVIQNVKVTLGADLKTLYGQNQWPVDSAVGKRSIKGSFEFAQMSNILMNQLFFADTVSVGQVATQLNESHSVPASGPYTITITPPSGTYVADFGVTYALTGLPLTKVPSTPATGQYSVVVSTGVYTFAAADTGLGVLINYTYTITATGSTLTVGNHPMGYGPVLTLDVVFPYEGAGIGFIFPNVRLGKIDLTTKLDDYTMLTTDFEAFAGAANNPFVSYQAY